MQSKSTFPIFLLGVLAFLLSGMPKVRVVIGAPIYLVDVIIFLLLLRTFSKRSPRFTGLARTLSKIICAYYFFVVLGELRGLLEYGHTLDSIYMLIRFSLALSLPFILPKIIISVKELTVAVKGLCAGLTLSALLSIMYSLPFTRGITGSIFAIQLINPVDKSATMALSQTLRGETLIGTSTFSSGLMAMLWPLLYMGQQLFERVKSSGLWRNLAKYALFLLPLGILATYGRSAWLSVVLVFLSLMVWSPGKGRAKIAFWLAVLFLMFVQVGLDSNMFMVDRIIHKTQVALTAPLEGESERERFLAYVEPFQHIAENPAFIIAGTGAASRKWGGNRYGEAVRASHAVFAMAYYAYGLGGTICQILMMVTSFRLIGRRLSHAQKHLPSMAWMWRALFAAWFGLLPWWLFAHGLVTQPRGAMAYFLYLGIILACERIYMQEVHKTLTKNGN